MILGSLNNDFVKGALVGAGVCAVGFYMYKKNEEKVDSFLREQGIKVPSPAVKDFYAMSLEELMETKENIEDIIAEKEISHTNIVSCCAPDAAETSQEEVAEA